MNYRERITSDYQVMLGKPVIKDTRLTVELLLRKLSEGAVIMDLLNVSLFERRGCSGRLNVCL